MHNHTAIEDGLCQKGHLTRPPQNEWLGIRDDYQIHRLLLFQSFQGPTVDTIYDIVILTVMMAESELPINSHDSEANSPRRHILSMTPEPPAS
jgi:hypothetical protein